MLDIEASILIRNTLLLQLIFIFLVPDYAFQAHQKLLKIWKSLSTPVPSKTQSRKKKTEKFWEIDMTKF